MSFARINDIEVDDPEELDTEQLVEYYDLAEKVKSRTKNIEYYLHIVEHEDDDEKVEKARRKLNQKKRAVRILEDIRDEHSKRRLSVDDRNGVVARYMDDKEALIYYDEENMEKKIKIKVGAVEKRICDSLADEILSDDLYGGDVEVRAELLGADRVLVTAKDGSRRAQIELTGTPA